MVEDEELLLHQTDSGRMQPWQPLHVEVAEGIELIEAPLISHRLFIMDEDDQNPWQLCDVEVAAEGIELIEAPMISHRLFMDEDDENDPDEASATPLAEDLAVDSGSEEEEELTKEQLLKILQKEEVSEFQDMGEFAWTADYAGFTGTREPFSEEVGPTIGDTSPIGVFTQIWDQPLLEIIREQTNLYAWQTIVPLSVSETGISAHSRLNEWVETSVSELYRLIAVMILMGMCVRGQIGEYWSTEILGMPGFRKIMCKNRFTLLMRFLHFNDNDTILGQGYDRKCEKISPLLEYLNVKFKAVYNPRRELSLDESLLLWKGKLSWVQCIRSKAARFGIKSYDLCEAATGYVLNLFLYTGVETSSSQLVGIFASSSARVVLKLLGDNYIGKGYTIFMDSYYTSVELCRYLKRRATDVVGTLNRRRQNTPADIKDLNERSMARGTVVSRHCGDVSVTAWQDVKLVATVSTYHNSDVVEARRAGQKFLKPAVIADYNQFMGGVDLKDQLLAGYLLERKRGMKWYIKVFKRLLNISILNSYIIHRSNIGQGQKLTHRQFRYKLAEQLLQKFENPIKRRARASFDVSCDRLNRLLDHYPEHCETGTDRTSTRQNKFKRGRCVRCLAAKKRISTSVFCRHCKVFLCVGKCFYEYHNLVVL